MVHSTNQMMVGDGGPIEFRGFPWGITFLGHDYPWFTIHHDPLQLAAPFLGEHFNLKVETWKKWTSPLLDGFPRKPWNTSAIWVLTSGAVSLPGSSTWTTARAAWAAPSLTRPESRGDPGGGCHSIQMGDPQEMGVTCQAIGVPQKGLVYCCKWLTLADGGVPLFGETPYIVSYCEIWFHLWINHLCEGKTPPKKSRYDWWRRSVFPSMWFTWLALSFNTFHETWVYSGSRSNVTPGYAWKTSLGGPMLNNGQLVASAGHEKRSPPCMPTSHINYWIHYAIIIKYYEA